MKKYSVYKIIGNKRQLIKPYSDSDFIYELFLKYQSEVVYKYSDMFNLINDNIEQLFSDELNNKYEKSFSGVLGYGEVQSGKTSNMISSIFWAYQQGFSSVFIFTGNTNPLHDQTIDRFKMELKNFKEYLKNPENYIDDEYIYNEAKILSKKIELSPAIKLRDIKNVVNKHQNIEEIALKISKSSDMVIYFVQKNYIHYEKCESIISKINSNIRNSILIIDDEADWGFQSNEELSKTLFDTLNRIKVKCANNNNYLKYIGFTATPYKILDNYKQEIIETKYVLLKSKSIQEWMFNSGDYIFKNQPFYCGAQLFHNKIFWEKKYTEKVNNYVQTILMKNYITEISNDYNNDLLIKESLILFMINSYNFTNELINSGKSMQNTNGLFFPDVSTDIHKDMYKNIYSYVLRINLIILELSSNRDADISIKNVLNKLELSKLSRISELIEKKLNLIGNLKPFLRYISNWFSKCIKHEGKIIIRMSGNDSNKALKENIYFNDDKSGTPLFIIGGYKISRGVTFNNLLLHVITHESKKEDSTLQRARWFGYRSDFNLLNMDIILSKSVYDSFDNAVNLDIKERNKIGN